MEKIDRDIKTCVIGGTDNNESSHGLRKKQYARGTIFKAENKSRDGDSGEENLKACSSTVLPNNYN